MHKREHGSGMLLAIVGLVVVAMIGFVGWKVVVNTARAPKVAQEAKTPQNDTIVVWEYDGQKWSPRGAAPDCPDPISTDAPTDVSKATSVLYPGQTRGGDYKPHGGLRFDGSANDDITVTAPLDAHLVAAARYIEMGEVQYLLEFQTPCGLAFRFDHLLTLSEAMQQAVNRLPAPKINDSRMTRFDSPIRVKAGEIIATAIGFTANKNVGFDFGLYDLRTPNVASKDEAFAAAHQSDRPYTFYGLCWLNNIKGEAASQLRKLPGGDNIAGKTSDYC